jgi:hypothetical protein
LVGRTVYPVQQRNVFQQFGIVAWIIINPIVFSNKTGKIIVFF